MASLMKSDHDGDHFGIGELPFPVTMFLIIRKLKLFGGGNLLRKFLAKIVHATENFCDFIPVSHKQKFCIWLSLNTLKIQTFAYFSKFLMRNSH